MERKGNEIYPDISVVLPTFNGEKYLSESIESVIKQSFKNWELIIVDDCSTDSTHDIILKYLKEDNRIKYIRNEYNMKLPMSLNKGFENALGRYYTWTSDDNMYESVALERMFTYLENHKKCPMVVADINVIDVITGQTNILFYDSTEIFINNRVGACFLYRKEVEKEIGGYNSNLFCVEDYDYWLRILKNCGEIDRIAEVLYKYRLQPNSLTAKKKDYIELQRIRLHEQNLRWILDKLRNNYNYILQLYNEFVVWNYYDIDKIKNIFEEVYPLIKGDVNIPSQAKIILFGAGTYGKKILNRIGDRVVFFSDHSEEKIGDVIDGKAVIAFDKMINLLKEDGNYHVILSSCELYQHQMILELYEAGINTFSVAGRCLRRKNEQTKNINNIWNETRSNKNVSAHQCIKEM